MLTVTNICKTFDAGSVNEVRALAGVSLHVPAGAFLVILGGNGSGKSTLLNAIAGSFQLDILAAGNFVSAAVGFNIQFCIQRLLFQRRLLGTQGMREIVGFRGCIR